MGRLSRSTFHFISKPRLVTFSSLSQRAFCSPLALSATTSPKSRIVSSITSKSSSQRSFSSSRPQSQSSPATTPTSSIPKQPPQQHPYPRLLNNKTALITGATTGIGRAIALAYIRHGARVAVNHLDNESGRAQFASLREEVRKLLQEGLEQGGQNVDDILLSVPGDVGKEEDAKRFVSETVRKWGRLDVFVSNAGVCEFREFLDITPSLWSSTLTTNLTGSFLTTQSAALQMSQQSPPGGSIIGISSISALVGGGQQGHYTPTKAGVLSLMQSAAVALGRYGIRCNALLPGTILTGLNERDLEEGGEKRRYMDGRCALGRVGVPEDMGGPAVFLACPELSGYVTGAQLLVDGGLFVNLQ